MKNNNFAKTALENGGQIKPLLIESSETNGTGLCNPSILIKNGKLIVNLRHVGYNLYHAEYHQKYKSWCGPLIYLHPEDDLTLRTENYIGTVDLDTLEIVRPLEKVNMTFNVTPVWTFIGLEDVRLVDWYKDVSMIGVRRDTKKDGEGRMEVTTIDNSLKELSRVRIEPPNHSYCEKNWMPIIDQPNKFVKWTNPTEVVEYRKISDTEGISKSILTSEVSKELQDKITRDIRGGSQVIPWGDKYIAVTHEVDLWKHEDKTKDAHYYHRFVVWDKDFNMIDVSEDFKFMDARVEFAAGMAYHEGNFYITYGFQDNAAYLLKVDEKTVEDFIKHG